MRRPVMAGNWKMYKTPAETVSYFEKFRPMVSGARNREIVICPPFISLGAAIDAARSTNIEIGAQNVFWEKEGAYTGEVSASMLQSAGCQWVIIGHSERRQYFGETDATVLKRTAAALTAGLKPIVCIGELLEERESGKTAQVLQAQFEGGIAPLTSEQFSRIVIAYEPVWAIGTGRTATPEMAAEAHRIVRAAAAGRFGGGDVRILYGGSVKPDNIQGLMSQEEIDGVLVGGASLAPESFGAIVNY